MNELLEHKSDPKGVSFVSLARLRELTQLAQIASTLMDHNEVRHLQSEHRLAEELLTWTIKERNKIVADLMNQIFPHGEVMK